MSYDNYIMCILFVMSIFVERRTFQGICDGRCCDGFIKVKDRCVECPAGKNGTNCSFNCPSGVYGKGCKRKCNCTKLTYCSSVYGCVPQPVQDGCFPGKYGDRCLQNCPPNNYGIDCRNTCRCKEEEYCHSEKGCKALEISDSAPVLQYETFDSEGSSQVSTAVDSSIEPGLADPFFPIQTLFKETWFRISVLCCIGVITIAVIVAIVSKTRRKIIAQRTRNSIGRALGSNDRGTIGGQSNNYSLDMRNDSRASNRNDSRSRIDDGSLYTSLRESSFIENDLNSGSKKQRKESVLRKKSSKKLKSSKADKLETDPCHAAHDLKDDIIDDNNGDDIILKANGYHQLNRNYSMRSEKKAHNYDDTQPPSHQKQNQDSYNMLELKGENTCDNLTRLGDYHQTSIQTRQLDDPIKENDVCTAGTGMQRSNTYSLVQKNNYSCDEIIKDQQPAGKSKSLLPNDSKDISKPNSKRKNLSNGKHSYTLARYNPEESDFTENTYTKTDFRRKKSSKKQLPGKVAIISRLSTLLTSKPSGYSASSVCTDALREDFGNAANMTSQEMPPPPPNIDSFQTDKGYTETRRNKYGYSLVRGFRLGDVIDLHENIADWPEATGCDLNDDDSDLVRKIHRQDCLDNNYSLVQHDKDLTECNGFPQCPLDEQNYEENIKTNQIIYNMTNNRDSEFFPLPPYPNNEGNIDSSCDESKHENDASAMDTRSVQDRHDYSLARGMEIPNSLISDGADALDTINSCSKQTSRLRRKKSTAKGVNGNVTIISRLSSLLPTNFKTSRKTLGNDTTAKYNGKDRHNYFVLEKTNF